jgi:GT2 family glycosyltransferase
MKLSTVILSFNSQRYLEHCIRQLMAALEQCEGPHEIFVCDNGSADGSVDTLKKLEAEFPEVVKGIYFETNRGTTVSRNAALLRARGEYILIIDSDTYVNVDAIQFLVEQLNQEPRCGMAVPALTYPDGRFQISVDCFPTLIHKAKRFFMLKTMENQMDRGRGKGESRVVDYAISAFWIFRREVLEKVGLLDERIFYSPEDVDFSIRIWKAGYYIKYFPEVSVIHDAQEISRAKGVKINMFTLSHLKGLLYLFLKHRYVFGLQGLYHRIGRTADFN